MCHGFKTSEPPKQYSDCPFPFTYRRTEVMCDCNSRVHEQPTINWRVLARAVIVMAENTVQSSRNMRSHLLMQQAWRLYREMCNQRGSGVSFDVPPIDPGDVAEWCRELLSGEIAIDSRGRPT